VRILSHTVIAAESGRTAKELLRGLWHISGSLLSRLKFRGAITVNGAPVTVNHLLHTGDILQADVSDQPGENPPILPVDYPLAILYEDEDLLLLDKPAGIAIHPAALTEETATVAGAVAHYLQSDSFHAVNRLDRGTEGLVIAAKKYTALRDMNEIIRNDWMKKEYLTITIGAPPAGRHVAWLQHSEKGNKVRIHAHESEGYKKIITDVTVIRCTGPFALCRIGLITGRTHQIRAHLAYLGHPVLGDIKYGNRNMNEKTGFKTQALCAQRLTFGNIPEENTLHYLSGRVIKLADPEIVKQFDALERKPGQE